jgi:hypothetical protein
MIQGPHAPPSGQSKRYVACFQVISLYISLQSDYTHIYPIIVLTSEKDNQIMEHLPPTVTSAFLKFLV